MTTPLALKHVSPPIPPLEQGDRLTRDEFERRYKAMPSLKKAQLIEGVVYMPSPVRVNHHASPHAYLVAWQVVYQASTPGVRVADNGTVRLDVDNEPQPDAFMMIEPAYGGQARIDEDDYVNGSPELIGEVAASSVSIDLHAKLRAYQRNGVREYIVWRIQDEVIDWFMLRRGRYALLKPTAEGICKSKVFPGLWLDPAALIRFDLARVLEVAQQGIASPEHARFVAKLQRARQS
jgi:hypothetical protein